MLWNLTLMLSSLATPFSYLSKFMSFIAKEPPAAGLLWQCLGSAYGRDHCVGGQICSGYATVWAGYNLKV